MFSLMSEFIYETRLQLLRTNISFIEITGHFKSRLTLLFTWLILISVYEHNKQIRNSNDCDRIRIVWFLVSVRIKLKQIKIPIYHLHIQLYDFLYYFPPFKIQLNRIISWVTKAQVHVIKLRENFIESFQFKSTEENL